MTDFLTGTSQWVSGVFSPPLRVMFHPMNAALGDIGSIWWKISAVALFAIAMVGV